jgi:hypothetical protein
MIWNQFQTDATFCVYLEFIPNKLIFANLKIITALSNDDFFR